MISKMCLTTRKEHYGQINTEMVQQTENLPSFIVGYFPPFSPASVEGIFPNI